MVKTESGWYAQALPDLIFEPGWFYGRLGPSRVCMLYKKGTEIHSDLPGIWRAELVNSVGKTDHQIEHELVEANARLKPPRMAYNDSMHRTALRAADA